jgi:RNA polymerase sigma-70 factor (ECF subfamily)
MAAQLGAQVGKPFTAGSIRQVLHRARERFAALLLDEVARTLVHPSRDDLELELIELGLLEYCRSALERHSGPA